MSNKFTQFCLYLYVVMSGTVLYREDNDDNVDNDKGYDR